MEFYNPSTVIQLFVSALPKEVREEWGLANVTPMIPFCRTVDEAEAVIDALYDNDLVRGDNGLEVYVMAEIPSNILLAEKFADL